MIGFGVLGKGCGKLLRIMYQANCALFSVMRELLILVDC